MNSGTKTTTETMCWSGDQQEAFAFMPGIQLGLAPFNRVVPIPDLKIFLDQAVLTVRAGDHITKDDQGRIEVIDQRDISPVVDQVSEVESLEERRQYALNVLANHGSLSIPMTVWRAELTKQYPDSNPMDLWIAATSLVEDNTLVVEGDIVRYP